MKKIILVALLALGGVCAAIGGNRYEFKNFVLNENEQVVVVRKAKTSLSLDQVVKRVEQYLISDDGKMILIDSLSTDTQRVYDACFQTALYYNPFSGATQRLLGFYMKISVENGEATIMLYSLLVHESYVGWTKKSNRTYIADRLLVYRDNLPIEKDKAFSKAQRKEAEDLLDDIEHDLKGSDEELTKRLDRLMMFVK